MTQEPQEPNIIENRPLSMENCSKKTGLTEVLEGISSLLIQLALMPFPDSGSCSLCRPFLTEFLSKTQSGDRSKDISGALYSGFALYWGNQVIFSPSLIARCISFSPDLLSFVKIFALGLHASSEQHSHPPCWFRFSGESRERTRCISSEQKQDRKTSGVEK